LNGLNSIPLQQITSLKKMKNVYNNIDVGIFYA